MNLLYTESVLYAWWMRILKRLMNRGLLATFGGKVRESTMQRECTLCMVDEEFGEAHES